MKRIILEDQEMPYNKDQIHILQALMIFQCKNKNKLS